jgi:copper oxidase (laccase) domain-containing protein
MSLSVLTSQVIDGSMYNRKNPADPVIIKNREKFLEKFDLTVFDATRLNPNANQRAEVDHETDWCRYKEVDSSYKGSGMRQNDAFVADAIVTKDKNHALFLPIADCVGMTTYDPVQDVVMLSHLGRHSLVQQGGVKSIEYLVKKYSSNPSDLFVWLTPAPNKKVFPIWALDNKGMKEVVFEQLAEAGVKLENITDNPADTASDLNYFSYSEFLKGHRDEDGDYAMVAILTD